MFVRRHSTRVCVVGLAWLVVCGGGGWDLCVQAAEPVPVRLFAEAEDFTVASGWEVVPYRDNYFAGTFAITFLSRMACLGAPEQLPPDRPAVATQTVRIPSADEYDVLVRYEQPYDHAVEFTLEVEQNGQVVGRFTCGRLSDPKYWAFTRNQPEPMVRYNWGGTDNIVWQHPGRVKLAAGTATLRLIATAQTDGERPRRNAARRHVDVICLTNDRAGMQTQLTKARYLPFDGWLVQDGDLFVRFTNPADSGVAIVPVAAPFEQGQHSPYYVHVRDWPSLTVLRSGYARAVAAYRIAGPRSEQVAAKHLLPEVPLPKEIPPQEYLAPGQSSGWVPLGGLVDALNHCQWFPRVLVPPPSDKPAGKGKPALKPAADVYLRLEWGVPDGQGGIRVVKDITVRGKAANLSPACFDIPGCVHPNPTLRQLWQQRYWVPKIRTQKEALEELNAAVAQFPKVGRVPKRLLIYGILGFSGAAAAFPEAERLALALGDNTLIGGRGRKRGLIAHWGNPDREWIRKQIAARRGGLEDVLIVSYGDEIHLPPEKLSDAELAAWLQTRGVAVPPGVKGPVRFATQRDDPFYYYSQLAAREKGGSRYVQATAFYRQHGVRTGANYSPHANYLVSEIDYVRTFRLRAMSMPWSEDYAWQIAEFSQQVVGYLVSGLRAGAKYDRLPIQMYVMPHSPGQTPEGLRRSFYTAIAHGATIINFFCASPSAVAYTENYVETDDLPMWRMIHRCVHEAGIFEDYVVDGTVRPAKVGLLLSSVDDLITGVNNFALALHNNERKAIYYALRHAQVPVDFLSEDDVIEGRAKDYTLIYVTQQYLHSRCVAALQQWCASGGTLVALCGGGLLDEWQRENPDAVKLYGARGPRILTDPQLVPRHLRTPNTPLFAKQDLPWYKPFDRASWDLAGTSPHAAQEPSPTAIRDVPVIAWKQPLEVTDGVVVGRFGDGTPAVVRKDHGSGRAILFGFLPGQAYLQRALPPRPVDRGASPRSFAHFLPTQLDAALRHRLVDDFLPGGRGRDARPVVTSDELVETTCIDTPARDGQPARLAIPLVNWRGRPIERLTLTVRDLPAAARVRSVVHGELRPTPTPDGLQITLPLDVADMILIDR